MAARRVGWGMVVLGAVAACEAPPAVTPPAAEPSIDLLYPPSGLDVPLTREGTDLYLDLLVVAGLRGVAFVPPVDGADYIDGQAHYNVTINGAGVDAPADRFFADRSDANAFTPGDEVQAAVSLASNRGEDLDGFDDWIAVAEIGVVDSTTPAPVERTAEVRFVHASPDAGRLDVYAAGATEPLARGLGYGDATPWREVDAGPLRVDLRAAGADPSAEPLFTDVVVLSDDTRVSAIAAGLVAGPAEGALRVLPVVEDWGNDVPGRARVRFVHAGADLPAVAIDGAGTVEVAPFNASAPAGETLDVDGGVRLAVREVGGDPEPFTRFTSPELAQGDDVLLIATGLRGSLAREPDGLRLLAIGTTGPLEPILQDPQLYVLHGSGDSGILELCSGTQEIAANFDYGQMKAAQVAPGSYTLKVFNYPAGCTLNALNGTGNVSTFEAGERYLVLLTGEQTPSAGEASIQAASFRDDFTLGDAANARVRFVHGASYTQVYVGVVADGEITAPNVLTPPIAWRVASSENTVGPGAITLGIADAEGTPPPPYSPIVTFGYTAVGGERQWGIVAGDPSPDDANDRFLQVLVVDSAPDPWTVALVDVE